ncbi:MAG: tetratricopeptide repeat protein, partial [bacterium]
PNDIETRMQLANLLLKQRHYNRALEEYEAILELDPNRKLVYNQLGYVHAYRGDFTTALKYLEKYAQLAPDEPNPYDSKGEILMMAGRLEEAVKELKTALSKRSSFYHSAMRLSEIYSEFCDLKDALEYCDKWIAEAPSPKAKTEALVQRAILLWRFGRIAEAEKALNLAMESSPTSVWPILVGGELYKFIGDTLAAKQLYRRYFDRHKQAVANHQWENYEIKSFLGFSLEAEIPPAEVIKIVEKLSKAKNQSGRLDPYLGIRVISHLRMGEHEKVMTYFGEQAEVLLDLLTKIPNEGWGSQWKYWVETTDRTPKQVSPDYTFCDSFLEAARKAGRKDLEVIARFLRAQHHAKYGLKEELMSEYRELGSPIEDAWRVIGPFENRSGFDRRFPPEETIDLDATYAGASGEITWQPATDGAYDGHVDLRSVLKRSSWAVGYGVVYVNSPEKRLVQLRVASDESCKLWLNDELVWQAYRRGDAPLDNDIITVMLRPGDNKLLIKVTNSLGEWGFYFRVTDEQGNGFPDLEFHPTRKNEVEIVSRYIPDSH